AQALARDALGVLAEGEVEQRHASRLAIAAGRAPGSFSVPERLGEHVGGAAAHGPAVGVLCGPAVGDVGGAADEHRWALAVRGRGSNRIARPNALQLLQLP